MNLKSPQEIAVMREGGAILARVRDEIAAHATEGTSLKELDRLAQKLTREAGAQPAFLGYKPEGAKKPYPAAICTSTNEVVVHGPPTDYVLRVGDLIKIDIGLLYKGFFTDTAITVGIGQVSPLAERLCEATKEALNKAIEKCRMGNTIGDIGSVINNCVKKYGFTPVKGLTGHGIGRNLHEEPVVFNEGRPGAGPKLVPGLVLAIEPIISAGSPNTIQLPDDSYATTDGSLSAHFEHTIAITEDGVLVLTR